MVDNRYRMETCENCGKQFSRRTSDKRKAKTCSRACAYAHRKPSTTEYGFNLSQGTMGAVGELTVSVDLMKRGYHVFRALSQSCPCDLLAYREGEPAIRIEVRTARKDASGKLKLYKGPRDEGNQDHYALVSHAGEILYVPELPE